MAFLRGSAAETQLSPEELQVVGAEEQVPSVPGAFPPVIEEAERRTAPPPVSARPSIPTGASLIEQQAQQVIYGVPIARVNRYTGTDTDWQPLVRWDITPEHTGDLHEISLLSTNDSKTRYRLVIGDVDQQLPTDRQTSTPVELRWRAGVIPGGKAVYVEVRSTDGTSITVDGLITGTER